MFSEKIPICYFLRPIKFKRNNLELEKDKQPQIK